MSSSAGETERIAAELADRLRPGDVVLVSGELGAGKTSFVRGACRALGVAGTVTSPTFTVGQRYPGPVPVAHLDLYRIRALADEDPDLLETYARPDTIAFIEWPQAAEQAGALSAVAGRTLRVHLEHAGGDRRVINLPEL